jgi:hypothetical protein
LSSDNTESVRWTEFAIVCPHCGNHGQEGGPWEANCWNPFRLIENVLRSFLFVPKRYEEGAVLLVADTDTDKVDWESGTGFRLECMQCFKEFALPEGFEIDFE